LSPGLLARANRGFLYIDEVNLLEDHLVDLLIDVAASGENVVEREGLSVRHPARFVLVGSGNPEEGELRPNCWTALAWRWTCARPPTWPRVCRW
jgi:magnesium chelatase subunit I